MKCTIFWRSDKEYNMTDKNGETHIGRSFQAFCADGVARRFTSEVKDYDVVKGATSFDPNRCVEVNLMAKIRPDGTVGWQDKTI